MPNENLSTHFTQFEVTTDLNATIAATQTISGAIDLSATYLIALLIPANFDGTQLQFKGSRDGITFYDIYNSAGTQLTATVAAGTACAFSAQDFAMWRFIKLVSVTTQTTTDTIIGLVTRPLS